jgi:hypothetical protein
LYFRKINIILANNYRFILCIFYRHLQSTYWLVLLWVLKIARVYVGIFKKIVLFIFYLNLHLNFYMIYFQFRQYFIQ